MGLNASFSVGAEPPVATNQFFGAQAGGFQTGASSGNNQQAGLWGASAGKPPAGATPGGNSGLNFSGGFGMDASNSGGNPPGASNNSNIAEMFK